MGAMGSVFAIIFGIGWTAMAFSMTRGSPFPMVGVVFPLFGVGFVCLGIGRLIYDLKNTVSKNRMSVLEITEDGEEPDPLNERFGRELRGTGDAERARPSARQENSTAGRLRHLDELKRSGMISEEEHRAQRKRILDQV